jgi:type IV pilus assembly protein PilC
VPIITALEVVKDSASNAVLEKVIVNVQQETQEGGQISTQLGRSNIFPPMVTQMVAIGEESGELEVMLEKIADFYDTEVDNAVESLTALMEPVFIVVLGGIVGAIVIAMYLPIFDVIKTIQ